MSNHSSLFSIRLAGVLAVTILSPIGALAQTPDSFGLRTNPTPSFAVTLLPGETIGNEQVIRALIRTGTNEFMFVEPEGMQSQTPNESTIVLTARDMNWYVSIRILGPSPAKARLKETLREQLAREYPQVNNPEEFVTTVADQEGVGLQLHVALPDVGDRLIRAVWVPFQAGVLEFKLHAKHSAASAAKRDFDTILLTFRSNERGRIEVLERSDKT